MKHTHKGSHQINQTYFATTRLSKSHLEGIYFFWLPIQHSLTFWATKIQAQSNFISTFLYDLRIKITLSRGDN